MYTFKKLLQAPGAFESIERWFDPGSGELEARYEAALQALESEDPRDWLAAAGGTSLGDDDYDHFMRHWVGDESFWPSLRPEACLEKMRAAYREAFSAALERGVPVVWVWVTPFTGVDVFEVEVALGANAVALVFVTSSPEEGVAPAA